MKKFKITYVSKLESDVFIEAHRFEMIGKHFHFFDIEGNLVSITQVYGIWRITQA